MPTFPPNATFTARLQLPRPGLDDPADGPDGFNDLTDVLDPITAIYAAGTTGARPAAGTPGRFYWSTDELKLYYDDGIAWRSGAGTSSVGSALPILDVGMTGQNRAGRQLTVADFTALGLAQPVGLWNLSNLSNLGSDGRALANKGAVTFAPGINGAAATAAQFTGSASQALYIADSGAADPFRIKMGSWGCWFRSAKRGLVQSILTKIGSAGTNAAAAFALNVSTNGAYATASDGVTAVTAQDPTDALDDRWHFAVATFDGTALRCYVDGALGALTTLSGALNAAAAFPLNIGGYGADAGTAAASPFFGRVDEAFVTADVLTEDQIRYLYAAKLTHTLGITPSAVRLNVHRRRKGAALAVADFPAQPLRLYNFTQASNGAGWEIDQGSNGATLTQSGAIDFALAGVDGARYGAVGFIGGSGAATDAGLPSALAARSYGCWFKTSSTVTQFIMAWGSSGTNHYLSISGSLLTSQSGGDAISGPNIVDGLWHFAVVVEDNAAGDGVRRKLYTDGRLVGVSTVLNAITLGGVNFFRVGAFVTGGSPFTGQIDGVFVCGQALTFEQVAALYAKGGQDLGASPKNPGDHIERVDATSVLFIADTLDSQHTIDLGVVA